MLGAMVTRGSHFEPRRPWNPSSSAGLGDALASGGTLPLRESGAHEVHRSLCWVSQCWLTGLKFEQPRAQESRYTGSQPPGVVLLGWPELFEVHKGTHCHKAKGQELSQIHMLSAMALALGYTGPQSTHAGLSPLLPFCSPSPCCSLLAISHPSSGSP